MPSNFTRPTLQELIDRAQTDIDGALQGVNARLRRTVEFVFARAMSGLSHGLHGHLAFIAEQILPDQAAPAFLQRWADLFGVPLKEGERAVGSIDVTGTGGTVPLGRVYIRPQDGVEYTVDAEVGPINGTVAVAITASEVGVTANAIAGTVLTLEAPISGIVSEAPVSSGDLTLGVDVETFPELLVRLLARIQKAPLGGAPGDHEQFALDVAGVTRAFEFKGTDGVGNPGLGKVALTFVRDNDGTGLAIIPDAGEVTAVQDSVQPRSPAELITFAPTGVLDLFVIELEPNTPEVQAAVDIELADLYTRIAVPGGTIPISQIREAVSGATGETDSNVTTPSADIPHAFGEMPIFDPASTTYVPLP